MYRHLRHIIFILAQFVWAGQLVTAQAILKVQPDTIALRIGEQTRLVLELKAEGHPQDFVWPRFHDTIVTGIEVLEEIAQDTSYSDDNTFSLRREFLVTSFDSGVYYFSGLSLLDTSSSDSSRVYAEPSYLEVFTLTIEEGAEIADIKPPISIPYTFREALPYILAVLGLMAIGFITWYIIARRKKGKPVIPIISKPKVPSHITALEALEILRKKKLWQEGKVKVYHSELTDILRAYLNGRFGIPAMEMVGYEIREALDELNEITVAQKEKAMNIFELADLVKFARWQPLPDENDMNLRRATEFVKETMPLSEVQADRNNNQVQKKYTEQETI